MAGEIFIRSNLEKSIGPFGKILFDLLSITFGEIRYSDNVSGGRYLIGSGLGLRFTLEVADHQNFEEYDFLLYFSPMVRTEANKKYDFDDLADTIAGFLASIGMTVARPLDFAREGTPSVMYTPKKESY